MKAALTVVKVFFCLNFFLGAYMTGKHLAAMWAGLPTIPYWFGAVTNPWLILPLRAVALAVNVNLYLLLIAYAERRAGNHSGDMR